MVCVYWFTCQRFQNQLLMKKTLTGKLIFCARARQDEQGVENG
jgi:hypothetical protein